MKKTSIFLLTFLTLLAGCKPQSKQNRQTTDESKTPFISILALDSLPQSIDLNQDISRCSYEELRLLRAYPYALHGHWFTEGDLNCFFDKRSEWYYEACYNRYKDGYPWDADYQKEMDATPLTDEERAFIRRIDERMAELKKESFIHNHLLNPTLSVNNYQLDERPAQLDAHLLDHNFALQPSDNYQLFHIYEENDYCMMPSFITSDLFLQTFHMYFSYVFKYLETFQFIPALKTLCTSLYHKAMTEYTTLLSASNAQRDNTARAATFFAIALRLLDDTKVAVPDGYADIYAAELANIEALQDDFSVLYPSDAQFGYSLFKPRGHYTRNEQAQHYFRAMMWLQTVFFCADAVTAESPCLFMATLLGRAGDKALEAYHKVTVPLDFLMGEADNLSVEEIWGCRNADDVQTAIDKLFEQRNRITPRIANDCVKKVNFMPQRYTPDGEILGKLVDVTPNAELAYPRGLDVFSAFGVRSAATILDTLYHSPKAWKEYVPEMNKLQNIFARYTDDNMYGAWMRLLVTLQSVGKEAPGFALTPAWACKNLNTALASWTELKHDAILYAEQPMGAECGGGSDFPEPIKVNYVEPNIPFWQGLVALIDKLKTTLANVGITDPDLFDKADRLREMVRLCLEVAEDEHVGRETPAEKHQTLSVLGSSIEWFTLSILDPEQDVFCWNDIKGAERSIALVADVYTRNIEGCQKDGILHEATGNANTIYVLVRINGETYLTRGATFSYYEFVRPLGTRLTDEEWQEMLERGEAPAVPEWMAPWLLTQPAKVGDKYIYSTGC
ncbi:MAG: DUF3160 domain-containing protein [Bacteroidaceae bacterium]|nr:DUF3160 domain-containing protein [Bacteroidaceae bacterium]